MPDWLCLLVAMAAALPASGAAPRDNACAKALPQSLRAALKDDLCGPGSPGTLGPALCVAAALKAYPKWRADALAELCRGASREDGTSLAPVSCAKAFKRNDPQRAVLALCAPLANEPPSDDASDAAWIQGPAACFHKVSKHSFGHLL